MQQEKNDEWRPVEYIARKLKRVGTEIHNNRKGGGRVCMGNAQMGTYSRRATVRSRYGLHRTPLAPEPEVALHFRLANWVMDIQALEFVVLHAAGNGELMFVSDALSRDFVEGSVLCERCLEVIAVIDEEGTASTGVETEMHAAQVAESGDLDIAKLKAPDLL
jgi:hypothetical protein